MTPIPTKLMRGSGKAVVFTESITTQDYLRNLLLSTGLRDDEITLFRGVNDTDRTQQAYARWKEEEGTKLPPGTAPTREVAVRLAGLANAPLQRIPELTLPRGLPDIRTYQPWVCSDGYDRAAGEVGSASPALINGSRPR